MIGKTPYEAMLERQVQLLQAEVQYYRDMRQERAVRLTTEAPEVVDVECMSKTLTIAGIASTHTSELGLHLMARTFPRFGLSGLEVGYYLSDLELMRAVDRAAVIRGMVEELSKELIDRVVEPK